MYVYIMYVYMYVYMYVCIYYVYMYVYMYICIYYVYMCVYMYVCIYYVYMYVYMYACMYGNSNRTWCCLHLPGHFRNLLKWLLITVDNTECWHWTGDGDLPTLINVTCNQTGRVVKFELNKYHCMFLCEVQIFGMLLRFT